MPTPTDEARAAAEWLAALAGPTRLKILRALAGGAETVSGLAAACGVPQSRVSHHVAALEHAGLIAVERDGRFRRCALVGAVTAAGIERAHPSGVKVVLPLG